MKHRHCSPFCITMKNAFTLLAALLLGPLAAPHAAAPKPTTPNIICMMAD